MSTMLFELGGRCFRHARAVVLGWVVLLLLLGAGAGVFGAGTSEKYNVPGSPGQMALDDLDGRFPELSGAAAQVVVVAPRGVTIRDAAAQRQIAPLVSRLQDVPGVTQVADPYSDQVEGALSKDSRAALVSVQLDADRTEVDKATLDGITHATDATRAAGYVAETGGGAFAPQPPKLSLLEAVGLGVALLVLYLTFRSMRAALLPLVSALAGAGATGALIMFVTAAVDVPGTAPLLALMIGIAVGIDYALFLLSRHREQLGEGMEPEESAALATATAGSAVVFAGITVLIALLGLAMAGLPFLSVMGVAAAAGVAIAVATSITLLPAILGLLGERLRPRHARPSPLAAVTASGTDRPAGAVESAESTGSAESPNEDGAAEPDAPEDALDDAPEREVRPPRRSWARVWVRAVTRWPVVTCVLVAAALIALAVPAKDLRLALPDNGAAPTSQSPRRAYDLVTTHFGPGANGPLIVTADIITSNDPLGLMDKLRRDIASEPGVESISLATPNRKADTGVVIVIPKTGPTDPATHDLVRTLRERAAELELRYDTKLGVTGQTAVEIDVSDRLAAALGPFALVVMGLSLVLLTIVFRSLVVPLTATLGFLLSTAAAFGVISGVFQHGWLAGPLGVQRVGPVISFMPIILMGVLFGLAMDYQVFLVSRMREAYVRGGDPAAAIETGFVGSGPVVAAAAAIMVAVFAAFVPHGDANLKPIALGLTVGVFLDAFIVRMIFVPAALRLFGHAAWAFPARLDAALPHLDVEGEVVHNHLERSREVREHPDRVVELRGLLVHGSRGPVVPSLDLHADRGQLVVLQGPDGSGKTSALLALAGRMPFDDGVAEVAGYVLPEQAGAVQRNVALAEFPGINDLDEGLSVRQHVAERLATRTLVPYAPSRDIAGVLAHYRDALSVAGDVAPESAPDAEVSPRARVGDLTGLERVVLGLVLAAVGAPPVIVVDDSPRLRSGASRDAAWAVVGWLLRTAPRPLTVVVASTEPVDAAHLPSLAGLPPSQVAVVPLAPARTRKVAL